ncbi:MAG TPA: signal peptidase I [Candidatus Fimimorpha faecalis]|uniref:Signal peptidase I n=1 Tax=Candidatus Fimimorpha faecalis TaxID=2840824 RepID=A0A9D1EBU7_9FIRM|nr:signal peptidase I [Candidatus Fimimorpha faecalis]
MTEQKREEVVPEDIPEQFEKKKSRVREAIDFILYLAVVAGICYVIVTFVGQRTVVSGTSMIPTLQDGDNLITDKISYRFRDPERYDIIVLRVESQHENFIKRVIGLPGETVQIVGGRVYINGELLESDVYGNELMISAGRASQPITLGENEYFVLGDNRNGSADSRLEEVGNVDKSRIIGRAFVRIWPLSQFGLLKHG